MTGGPRGAGGYGMGFGNRQAATGGDGPAQMGATLGMAMGMGNAGMRGRSGNSPGGMGIGLSMDSRRDIDDEDSGGGNAYQGIPGASGVGQGMQPLLQEKELKEIEIVDRTDFVVQFIWIPTLEKARTAEDPRPLVTSAAEVKK